MNIAIILAGGIGSRVGFDVPKQFVTVAGRPILAYTIDKFESHGEIDLIIIVCNQSYIAELSTTIKEEGYNKVCKIVPGGETFQGSVINGLNCIKDIAKEEDIVLFHYGASPFVDSEIISDAIRVCKENGNASPARGMTSLGAYADQLESTNRYLNRDEIICLNSPQAVCYGYVCELYEKATNLGILDSIDPHTTSLMLSLGERIYYSLDKSSNIKITTRDDIDLFRAWVYSFEH